MNKSDLIREIAQKADLTFRAADEFVNIMFDSMSSAMVQDERIEVRGFAQFCCSAL